MPPTTLHTDHTEEARQAFLTRMREEVGADWCEPGHSWLALLYVRSLSASRPDNERVSRRHKVGQGGCNAEEEFIDLPPT
jgi:hypothetical protein